LNPVIVIPSYWALTVGPTQIGEEGIYDFATPIAKPLPELQTCLESLESVRGVLRVVILLVAPPEQEESARARVDGICRQHRDLNPLVIGSREARYVRDSLRRIVPRMANDDAVGLRGYGAIRNLGLAVAAVLGHDVVVFLDDDNVALDENFLIDAVYGLGMENRQSKLVLAKTGRFIDESGSPYADETNHRWCDRWWPKEAEFNQLMRRMLEGRRRISRANDIYHGCFALHVQAFSRVAFDPQITRGEALDYLINLRMQGIDVWFDRDWLVRRTLSEPPSEASKFLQDVYRWTYEKHKVASSKGRIGTVRVTPGSLAPYPRGFVGEDLEGRISKTALARAVAGPERSSYWWIWRHGRKEAEAWAKGLTGSYAKFLTFWPRIIASLWNDGSLGRKLLSSGEPAWLDGEDE